MRRVFFASCLVLLAGCASTTVTRVVADDPIQYPHGKVHVGWSEYRLLFPLMIHADAALPPIGKSIPAQKAFRDISISNCRSNDKEYPEGGRGAWLQKMEGSLHLLSERQIMIDAYFLDSVGGRHPYPFSGKHRIVKNESN